MKGRNFSKTRAGDAQKLRLSSRNLYSVHHYLCTNSAQIVT